MGRGAILNEALCKVEAVMANENDNKLNGNPRTMVVDDPFQNAEAVTRGRNRVSEVNDGKVVVGRKRCGETISEKFNDISPPIAHCI